MAEIIIEIDKNLLGSSTATGNKKKLRNIKTRSSANAKGANRERAKKGPGTASRPGAARTQKAQTGNVQKSPQPVVAQSAPVSSSNKDEDKKKSGFSGWIVAALLGFLLLTTKKN